MSKHIIDTTSPDFDGIPMGVRESLSGEILLKEDRKDGHLYGIVSISIDQITEIIPVITFPITVNSLDELKQKCSEFHRYPNAPTEYQGKHYIEFLADDVCGANTTGRREQAHIFEDVMDEAASQLEANGIDAVKRDELKAKFANAAANV